MTYSTRLFQPADSSLLLQIFLLVCELVNLTSPLEAIPQYHHQHDEVDPSLGAPSQLHPCVYTASGACFVGPSPSCNVPVVAKFVLWQQQQQRLKEGGSSSSIGREKGAAVHFPLREAKVRLGQETTHDRRGNEKVGTIRLEQGFPKEISEISQTIGRAKQSLGRDRWRENDL